MKIQILFPTLPPEIDGIGDHTARIATELAVQGHDITILTGQSDAATARIPGVEIQRLFSRERRGSISSVAEFVRRSEPDWLLLQYNPFSYGRWGLNLALPAVLEAVRFGKGNRRRTRVAAMIHEAYVPVINARFAVMATWQRWQFHRIGKCADVLLFSMSRFLDDFAERFPRARLAHAPVGSNLPKIETDRVQVRARLGISPRACVLGIFGTAHASRRLEMIASAARGLIERGRETRVLYTGTDPGHVRSALAGLPVIADGPLSGDEASKRLSASDIYLAPFIDGVSSRRGSFIAGLQHGVACVTTLGDNTDRFLREQAGRAFLAADVNDSTAFDASVRRLAEDEAFRTRVANAGTRLHDEWFAWPAISARIVGALSGSNEHSGDRCPIDRGVLNGC